MATLLLVENSQAVLPMWPDLRDRYLQPLVAKLESRSPRRQVSFLLQMSVIAYYPHRQNATFLTLESIPSRHESQSSVPRHHESVPRGLQELSFDTNSQKSLTVRTIWSGVDVSVTLESIETMQQSYFASF